MSLFLPSYDNGFAPRDFAPEYPELWDGLVGAWCPSLGATGTSLFDQSGYGNNGTLTNFTLSSAWANPLTFNGAASNRVALGNVPNLNFSTGSFTIACWITPTTITGAAQGFFCKQLRWQLLIATGPKIEFDLYDGTHNPFLQSSAISANTQYFVVGVRGGGNIYLYVNGKLQGSAVDTTTDISSSDTVAIGVRRESFSEYFTGIIDGVTADKRMWSASEVQERYALGPGGIYTPSSRQASLIPNIATGNRRRRVIIGAA